MADKLTTWFSKIAKSTLLTVGIIILMPSLAMAQPFDRDKAQSDMMLRVIKSAGAFATQIGLPNLYVNYCLTKLNLSTTNQPKDGSIPYGVSYITAPDETIRMALSAREQYETAGMGRPGRVPIACIGRAQCVLVQL